MVKCAECGFLSVRNIETRNLEEIEFESRQSGDLRGRHYYLPICFVKAANLGEKTEALKKLPENATRQNEIGEEIWPKWSNLRKTVFNNERICKSFVKWQQGYTPKEHREMIDREREKKWRLIEISIIVLGNIIAGCLGAYLVWMVSNSYIKPPV